MRDSFTAYLSVLLTTAPGRSPWAGFKLAMQDIKVPIFAVMTCSQLLGLSFVNFFPT